MSVRQYIGARYVTKIYENTLDPSSAEWQAGVSYEPLTLVTYLNGSYLSKKTVPGSVGDPASSPTFWAQTGFYNGQIAGLQAQINEINNTIYIVGPNAKYQTITAAYNDCVANGGGTILITEGTYDEAITGGVVTVPVTFLGTDRNKCIWKSSTYGYANACFTGSGDLTFENLTMYKPIPAGETTQGGYALHMDYPGATGSMYVNNCTLISEENSAIGCGTRTDQQICIENCYLEFRNKNSISMVNGALLYHTAPEAAHTGQSFKLRNCLLKSDSTILNIYNSAANTENVPLEVINNTFYSTAAAFQPDKITWESAFGFSDVTVNSAFSYQDGDMFGNNCNTFSKNKFSQTYNNATKANTGMGFTLSADLLTSNLNNCFIYKPSSNTTEQPGGFSHDCFGFCFGGGTNWKVCILQDSSNGATYKKVIRSGAVYIDWVQVDFGQL